MVIVDNLIFKLNIFRTSLIQYEFKQMITLVSWGRSIIERGTDTDKLSSNLVVKNVLQAFLGEMYRLTVKHQCIFMKW